jgi:hypothetical protein
MSKGNSARKPPFNEILTALSVSQSNVSPPAPSCPGLHNPDFFRKQFRIRVLREIPQQRATLTFPCTA